MSGPLARVLRGKARADGWGRLTPSVRERILTALRAGNSRMVAMQYGGIPQGTWHGWMQRADPAHPNFAPRYAEFKAEIELAETDAEVRAVNAIMRAGLVNGDTKSLQWWLERRHPDRWGRRDRLALSGPNDGPVQVQATYLDLGSLSDDDLRDLLAIMDRAREDAAHE